MLNHKIIIRRRARDTCFKFNFFKIVHRKLCCCPEVFYDAISFFIWLRREVKKCCSSLCLVFAIQIATNTVEKKKEKKSVRSWVRKGVITPSILVLSTKNLFFGKAIEFCMLFTLRSQLED